MCRRLLPHQDLDSCAGLAWFGAPLDNGGHDGRADPVGGLELWPDWSPS